MTRSAIVALCLVAGACATPVTSTPRRAVLAPAALQRPARILVEDFSVDPQAVVQDRGIGARLRLQMAGDDAGAAQAALAGQVPPAITQSLVSGLVRAGLPAMPAPPGTAARPGDLLLLGEITRIDEGKRQGGPAAGNGACGTIAISAGAQLYAVAAAGLPSLLQNFDGQADPGRKLGVDGERQRGPVGTAGDSFGRILARQIAVFAADHGWIARSAVPDVSAR